MNCPHCGSCDKDEPCAGRMGELVEHAFDLVRSLACCDHRRIVERADGPMCIDCGARKVPEHGQWELPEGPQIARSLYEKMPVWAGRVEVRRVDPASRRRMQ